MSLEENLFWPTEVKLMTMRARIRKVGGAASAVGFARIFSLIVAVIQLPVLTRILQPSDYALVSLAMAAGLYFSLISAEPTILPFQRFPGTFGERGNFSYAFGRLLFGVGFVGVLVAVVGFFLNMTGIAFALAGWGVGIAFNRFVATAWIMWERPWPYSWTLVLGTGVRVGALIGTLSLGLDAALAVGLAGILSGVAVLLVAPRPTRTAGIVKVPGNPWNFHFGVSLGLASLAFTLLLNFNLLFLPVVSTSHVVAVYAAMNQVAVLTLGSVLGVINTLLYPKLQSIWNAGRQDHIRHMVNLICRTSILLGVVALLFVQLFGDQVLSFVVGSSFSDTEALSLQLAAAVFANVGLYLSWLHLLNVKSNRIRNVSLASALIGTGVSVLLIFNFGLLGAGIGLVISFALYSILMSLKSTIDPYILLDILTFTLAAVVCQFLEDWISSSVMSFLILVYGYRLLAIMRRARSAPNNDDIETVSTSKSDFSN